MKFPRPWRIHLILLALFAGQALVATALHRDRDALLEAWHTGDTSERLGALHVLTNRGEPRGIDQEFVLEMLGDPDLRVREAAMGLDLAKFSLPAAQENYLSAADFGAAVRRGGTAGWGQAPVNLPPTEELAHWWRAHFLHRRKVGGYIVGSTVRPRHQEIAWFLDAMEEKPPPRQALFAHIIAIHAEKVRRMEKSAPEPTAQ